jgi:LPS sulfotransferase NodH
MDDSETDAARYLASNEERLAWIMGSSRSGSTWLLRMLSELDEVAGIDDPHLGHHLGVWRPLPLAWATAAERPELTTLVDVKRDKGDYLFSDLYRDSWMPALRELVRARFGAQLERQWPATETPTLIVKEPGSHAAEQIFDAFPSSRLVFLLRDGRDVVDSWIDAYQSGSWALEEGAFAVASSGRRALVEWLASVWAYRTRAVGEAFGRRPRGSRILVRYEDLLADTPGELRRICEMLEIEAGDDTVGAIVRRHAFEHVDPASRGSRREIRAAEPGAWRRNLTLGERRAMEEIMGAQLEAFGYARRVAAA